MKYNYKAKFAFLIINFRNFAFAYYTINSIQSGRFEEKKEMDTWVITFSVATGRNLELRYLFNSLELNENILKRIKS